jgi:hypothetical protein
MLSLQVIRHLDMIAADTVPAAAPPLALPSNCPEHTVLVQVRWV